MRVDRRDQRCMVVNVDPQTLERDPSILRTIANERQSRLGVYGTPVAPATSRSAIWSPWRRSHDASLRSPAAGEALTYEIVAEPDDAWQNSRAPSDTGSSRLQSQARGELDAPP